MTKASERKVKRDHVIQLHEGGCTPTGIFDRLQGLGYSMSFIERTIRRWRTEKTTTDHKRTGRPRTVRTAHLIKLVRDRLRRCKQRRTSRLAASLETSQRSMHRLLRVDLGVKAFKRQKRQQIPPLNYAKRLERCRAILGRRDTGPILFTDEKKWTVEEAFNPQNDRIWATSIEEARASNTYYVGRIQNPAYVMVWGAISEEGKFALEFLPDEKITGHKYRELVLKGVVGPRAAEVFGDRSWTFQQDSAPAHKSNLAHNWLAANVPDFISRDEWPPNSPDLNPCDYYLWGRLEDMVNTKRYESVESLKAAITAAWDALDNAEVTAACSAFKKRLRKCVKAKGGLFEMD
jgi:hypothetical protein